MILEIYTDGATEGHNGPLGTVKYVGLGVYCPQSGYTLSAKVDGGSCNEAEFMALIKGMEYAITYEAKEVKFYLDSQIVVNRANGSRPKQAKHKNERMDAFQDEVLELAKKFDKISFNWIPREENEMADRLSSIAVRGS